MAPPKSKDQSSDRLPFEPKRRQKRAEKAQAEDEAASSAKTAQPKENPAARKREDAKAARVQAAKEKLAKMQSREASDRRNGRPDTRQEGIPEEVSRRMLKRMTILSGAPMVLGVGVFFISYYIVSRDLFPLPTVAVLLTSLGFFGLSVLGLSYGVLSASWEEDEVGGLVGWREFRLNFGRLVRSWKAPKETEP